MRLLVVGASGFLGRNIVRAAAGGRWDVTGVYWRSRDFSRFAREHGVEAVRHDLLADTRAWSADACIYLAGNSDHLGSARAPLDDLQRNVGALLRFLVGYSGSMVFMSSAAVYEGHRGLVSPSTSLRPTLPYAITKMACERYLAHFVAAGKLASATVLRLYYAYGPYDRETRLVPSLVRAAHAKDKTFCVTAPRGALVDPMYADDVAKAALAAASGRGEGETMDLCAGDSHTVPALVRRAIASQGWRLRLVVEPRAGERPPRFRSDPRPARRTLRLGAYTPLGVGLRRYIEWRSGSGM